MAFKKAGEAKSGDSAKSTATKTTVVKKATAADKKEARHMVMDAVMQEAEKKYGVNVLYRGFPKRMEGDFDDLNGVPRIKTGIPSLDIDLGGGIPIGRYTEIQGGLSTYKSTICSHVIRNFQQTYEKDALYADAEGTMTDDYCEQLEIDPVHYIYNPSAGLEETTQIILDYMDADNECKLAIVDSIEALVPVLEYKTDMDESNPMLLKPRLLSEFFRKFQAKNNLLMRKGSMPFTLIGINQLREKPTAYGGEFAPGGRAKGFAASVVLKLRRGDFITEGTGDSKVIVGHTIKYNLEKNKTSVPQRVGEFDMYCDFNKNGIKKGFCDVYLSIILEAISFNLIERGGSYFSFAKDKSLKFQGKDKLIEYLRDNPGMIEELQTEITDLLNKTK